VVEFFGNHGGIREACAQLCTNLDEMPVEDASKVWPEKKSPYRGIARITVEPQAAWSPARSAAVDDGMSFSPWHGLAAHRPLGSIMRSERWPTRWAGPSIGQRRARDPRAEKKTPLDDLAAPGRSELTGPANVMLVEEPAHHGVACSVRDMPMALVRQDAPSSDGEVHHYDGAVGGWGSLKGLSAVVLREKPGPVELGEELLRQNKHGGFMCVSCAWGKPEKPNPAAKTAPRRPPGISLVTAALRSSSPNIP
jgi:hypothetical protein